MKQFSLFLSLIFFTSCGHSDDPKGLELMQSGNKFMDSRNFNSALINFRQASTFSLSKENQSKNYRNIAVVFLYLNQSDSALKYSKLGMECIESNSYYHLINKAEYYLLKKETKKAIKTFEKAKKLKPKEMEVYNNLSLIYAGNYGEQFLNLKEALANALEAFKINPNAVNQEQLASVYFQSENYSKAAKLFHELANLYPAVKLYQFYEGQSVYFEGNEEFGLQLMEDAAERDEKCRQLFDELVS